MGTGDTRRIDSPERIFIYRKQYIKTILIMNAYGGHPATPQDGHYKFVPFELVQ